MAFCKKFVNKIFKRNTIWSSKNATESEAIIKAERNEHGGLIKDEIKNKIKDKNKDKEEKNNNNKESATFKKLKLEITKLKDTFEYQHN